MPFFLLFSFFVVFFCAFFFFFQAEDGIRDLYVTGVQTCALPISVASASCVYLFRLPRLAEATEQADPHPHTFTEVLRHRHVRLGVLAIFVYVGAEVTIGSFLISYITAARIGNIDAGSAAHYVSYYWGAAMTGRFIGSALLRRIAPRVLLCVFALVAVALLATTILSSGALAMWSVIAIGLFNSIMFPTLFTLGIEGLGPLTPDRKSTRLNSSHVEIYTLSLHDALPISSSARRCCAGSRRACCCACSPWWRSHCWRPPSSAAGRWRCGA